MSDPFGTRRGSSWFCNRCGATLPEPASLTNAECPQCGASQLTYNTEFHGGTAGYSLPPFGAIMLDAPDEPEEKDG